MVYNFYILFTYVYPELGETLKNNISTRLHAKICDFSRLFLKS